MIATDQAALTNKLLVTPDLPAGAATAAKQPALGTAGAASADVISVQGIAAMTKLLVTADAITIAAAQTLATVTTVSTVSALGTGSTGPQKAEDAAHTTADAGLFVLGVREGTPVDLSAGNTNGDYEPFELDAVGRVWVRTASEGGQGSTLPVYSHHVPAVNVVATIGRAAGAAGVRTVCLGFTVTITAGSTAPTAAVPVTVALIDGATGGTTYLWRQQLGIPTTTGVTQGFVVDGWFEGTAATAMTLEFSGAGGANTFEVVSMRTIQITE